jgi:hypothetical protein
LSTRYLNKAMGELSKEKLVYIQAKHTDDERG